MRIHVDLASHVAGDPKIVQAEAEREGQAVPVNGKYVIPLPPGVDIPVSSSSYVLDGSGDVDGGDVTSLAFARLLALYPQYHHIYFNPLLTAQHVSELDLGFTFKDLIYDPPVYHPCRLQTGRPNVGQMPTHTAVLPQNNSTTPPRPGVLITEEIDLSSFAPAGAEGFREFFPYWRLLSFSTTHDVAYGNLNEPAVRYLIEPDQQPSDFEVYLTPDGGQHWCQVDLMEPISLAEPTTSVRLAFVNRGSEKVYLAHFAVLF